MFKPIRKKKLPIKLTTLDAKRVEELKRKFDEAVKKELAERAAQQK